MLGVMVETSRVQPRTALHPPCPRGHAVEPLCAFNALGMLGVLCKTLVGYGGPGSEKTPCCRGGSEGGRRPRGRALVLDFELLSIHMSVPLPPAIPCSKRCTDIASFYHHNRLRRGFYHYCPEVNSFTVTSVQKSTRILSVQLKDC